jgi:CheY-like chemotaxis protein
VILADLMMETVDVGGAIASKLKEVGGRTPAYIVSSAADALVGSVGLHELGVSGVFLKPADPAVVIQILETRLGVR